MNYKDTNTAHTKRYIASVKESVPRQFMSSESHVKFIDLTLSYCATNNSLPGVYMLEWKRYDKIFRWMTGYRYQLAVDILVSQANRYYFYSLIAQGLAHSAVTAKCDADENNQNDCDVLSAGRKDGSIDSL